MSERGPEKNHGWIEALDRCARCGKCRSVCPAFKLLQTETDVARGRISLLQAKAEGKPISKERLRELFYSCIKCYRCEGNCPSQVKYGQIISRMGFDYGMEGFGSRMMAWLLRFMLPRRGIYDLVVKMASWLQKVFPSPKGERIRHLPISFFHRKSIPSLAETPALKLSSMRTCEEAESVGSVVFLFTGCLCNYVYPEMAEATKTVLEYAGFQVRLPKEQLCCGMPLKAIGDREGAAMLAERNMELFERYCPDWIVSPCPTCTGHLKRGYPELWDQRALPWSERCIDMSELLCKNSEFADRLRATRRKQRLIRITYHDPCHLLWVLENQEEPRTLLRSLAELIEPKEGAQCCGMGGIFSAVHPLLAAEIGTRRAEELLSVDPEEIVTGCPGCILQLKERTSARGENIPVTHTAEFIARCLLDQDS